MRDFRFGVGMRSAESRAAWADKCRRAEELGFDVLLTGDHLGMVAPFPAMMAAAAATERARVGTFTLNAGFWNPTLLAREVVTADQLTGGRLELGLGAGHMKYEFDAAGIPWKPHPERIEHLERTIHAVTELLSNDDDRPRSESSSRPPLLIGETAQHPRPPLLVGAHGKAGLRLAAAHADTIGFSGLSHASGQEPGNFQVATAEETQERVDFVRGQLGGREAEFNVLVQSVVLTDDRRAAAAKLAGQRIPHLTAEQVLDCPYVLVGTPEEIAGQLRERRERFGFSYISTFEWEMDKLAEAIPLLRG